ncbi:hypothetical protein [Brevibacterium senegalense]|uniref:hypothetical protein n=1 Tax=Brevibacterium senegalense TaxID=1033736 RepID=UPI0011C71CA9|nr:hypothetical protein [Brevibacterium senegalense]
MTFNPHDHLYLSYNKPRGMTDPFAPRPTAFEVEGDFKASIEGGASLTSLSVSSSAEAPERVKYTALPGVDPTQRTQLLSVAATTLEHVERAAEHATASTTYQAGSTYSYTGPCRFRVVTHDDWRSADDEGPAPALALWLVELINPTDADRDSSASDETHESSESDTVTWILLSGTADGQLTTSESLDIPTSRAGSQTEPLFEEHYCHEFGATRASGDERWLQGHWRGTSTRNMIGPSSQGLDVELLFRCHSVHPIPSTGKTGYTATWTGAKPAQAEKRA